MNDSVTLLWWLGSNRSFTTIPLKDNPQTWEEKLLSTRTWSLKNIRCSQKILRYLEMSKIDSNYELPSLGDYDILVNFKGHENRFCSLFN